MVKKSPKQQKPKIIAIVGPTASGKSDLAVALARIYNGEIISADSRQVYTGLNLGTGKITKKEMLGVHHHLLDVANPKKQFTVGQYKILADKAISDILSRGKLPILCGGTGFYIEAVVDNIIFPDVPANKKLREQLAKKSADQLFKQLQKLDAKRAQEIDPKNKVRVIRAIEISKALGKVPAITAQPHYTPLLIGISTDPVALREKITIRLISRIKKGMITEAKKLHTQGVSWKRMHELGLEYRYLALYVQNKISKPELIEQLGTAIWHYVKRQITWFKRDSRIHWFTLNQQKKIQATIKKFLK